jgi:hypothetical protein
MRKIFFFILTITALQLQAQIKGYVKDKKTNERLAFVNIVFDNEKTGTSTGIDGKFQIENSQIKTLTFSYLGYKTKTIDLHNIANKQNIVVSLSPTSFNVDEIVITAGENPAHRIVKLATENRNINRPEHLKSFEYTSYNKMYFTFDFILINNKDTLRLSDSLPKTKTHTDSAMMQLQDFNKKQYLFMTESVSKRKFMHPDKNHETILASKVSGFKEHSFALIATQMQSLTIYDDYISILDKNYLSPISKGSTKKYFYKITDTLYNKNNDTVFVIFFRPFKGKNFNGLTGVMQINTDNYAVQNIKAEPYDKDAVVFVKIRQKYKKIDNKQWFPVQLNTEIIFKKFKSKDKKQTLNFDIIGIGKSYLQNIKLNPQVSKKEFNHIVLNVDKMANKKDEDFWKKYRTDSLTIKEKTTYKEINKIGDSLNLDRKFEIYSTLFQGYFPLGYINIDLTKIIGYNNFEGFTAGLRLTTGNKISKTLQLGGYFRYGFNDYEWKYGGNIDLHISKKNEVDLQLHYFDDVAESSAIYDFYDKKYNLFENSSSEAYRKLFIADMYKTQGADIELHFRAFKYLKTKIFGKYSFDNITNNYVFIDNENKSSTDFYHTQTGIKLKYAYKEKFVESEYGLISLGTKYPVVYFNFIIGTDLFNSTIKYTKYELLLTKSFTFRNLGETSFIIKTAYTPDNIPYIYLYNGYASKLRQFTIEAQNTFATMNMNEFLSSELVYLFFRHNFKSLLFKTKWFKPGIAFATNIGWGNLKHTDSHKNLQYKTMNKVYYESGLTINNIVKYNHQSFGFGVYYRYGTYAFDNLADNFAYKLSFAYKF